MPRGGRSGGGFRSGGSSRSSSRSTSTSPPRQSAPTQTPTAPPRTGGMGSGLMGTLVQGMAFGAGSEVAHQAIRGVMGGNSHSAPQQQQEANGAPAENYSRPQTCEMENSNFVECLKFNNNEIARCQEQFNAVQNCQKMM